MENTPTRSRGMSTPSDTIRTDTIHGRSFFENSSIFFEAPGSSLTTTSAGTWKRSRSSRAMPWACSWSVAITRPPASGWPPSSIGDDRSAAQRSWSTALESTVGIHSPSRLSAVRKPHRRLVPGQFVLERRRELVARRPWSTPSHRRRGGSTRGGRRRRRAGHRRSRRCSRRAQARLRRWRRSGRTGSERASLRKGVPDSDRRRCAMSRKPCGCRRPRAFLVPGVVDLVEDHESVRRQSPANFFAAPAPVATCWYVVTSPCTSRGRPSPGDQWGSSCSPRRCAA